MTESRVLTRYVESAEGSDRDATDALVQEFPNAFGWLRGHHDRAIMLELRKKNGNCLAIGYGWIERVAFDPSIGITLHLGDQTVRISGRNLNAELRTNVRLFEGITRHRVPWIRECGELERMVATEDGTVVERIEWE